MNPSVAGARRVTPPLRVPANRSGALPEKKPDLLARLTSLFGIGNSTAGKARTPRAQPGATARVPMAQPGARHVGSSLVQIRNNGVRPTPAAPSARQPVPSRPSSLLQLTNAAVVISLNSSQQLRGLDAIAQAHPAAPAKIERAVGVALQLVRAAAQGVEVRGGNQPSSAFGLVIGHDRERAVRLQQGFRTLAAELERLGTPCPSQRARFIVTCADTSERLAGYVVRPDPAKRIILPDHCLGVTTVELAATLIHQLTYLLLDTEAHHYICPPFVSEGIDSEKKVLDASLAEYFSSIRAGVLNHDPLSNADTWNALAIQYAAKQRPALLSELEPPTPATPAGRADPAHSGLSTSPAPPRRVRFAGMTDTRLRAMKSIVDAGAPLSRSDARDALWTLVDSNVGGAATDHPLMSADSADTVVRAIDVLSHDAGDLPPNHDAYLLLGELLRRADARGTLT